MKILEIEWIDAQSSMDQIFLEEMPKFEMSITKSCGYLIHEDKEKIVLAFMLFGNESVKHWQMIPRKMIKKSREVISK